MNKSVSVRTLMALVLVLALGAVALIEAGRADDVQTMALTGTGRTDLTTLVLSEDLTVGDTLNVDGDIDYDGDGFDVDTTGAVSIDADAASNFNVAGAGIDLTLESEAGRLVLKGDEAAANGITIDANDAVTTGLDIDVGSVSGMTIDGGLLDIGGGTCGVADGDNDVCIAAVLEVDGELEADGAIDADSDLDVDGTTNLDDADIDLSASLNIDGHMVDIGTGSYATADGDNDLGVAGDLEVDGASDLQGSISDTGGTLTVADNMIVDGAADAVQLTVQGYTTQTNNILVVEETGGTDLFWVTNDGDAELNGTTPVLTMGDAGEEDSYFLFDGNAQDFYVGLDDTEDDFLLGLGNAMGTTGIVFLDENQDVGLGGASAGAKLDVTGNVMVDGGADEVQMTIQHHSTQTNAGLVVESSDGTDIFGVYEAAAAGSGGDLLDLTETFGAMNGSDALIGIDINLTGADHSGTSNSLTGIDLDLTTADAQTPEVGLAINDADWDYAIETGDVPILATAQVWVDDFFGDALNDELVLLNGADAQAVDPALSQEQYGVVTLVSGDVGDGCANDCSELALGLHWQADQGSLVFETRLHVDTSVANVWLCAGLTDRVDAVEIPFDIGAGDTITNTADDALAFCYSSTAATSEWFALGSAGGTGSTGRGAAGVAPVANTYQVLRIEVDIGGADARFYINGSLVKTLTANAITVTDPLTPIIAVASRTTASQTVDVDYVYVGAQRQ